MVQNLDLVAGGTCTLSCLKGAPHIILLIFVLFRRERLWCALSELELYFDELALVERLDHELGATLATLFLAQTVRQFQV